MIELLAVAAIIAMLAGVALLRLGRSGSGSAVMRAGRELYLTAKYARAAAVQSGQKVQLVVDDKQGRFWLEKKSSGEDGDAGQEIADSYSRMYELAGPMKIERFKTEGQDCLFYPDGRAEPALVQIGDGKSSVTVLVNTLGRARLVSGMAEDVQTGRVDLDAK